MTPQLCASYCSNYDYFGVEFAQECFCGQSFTAELVDDSQCTTPCAGDATVLCGGGGRINVYKSTLSSGNEDIGKVGDFTFLHCGVDSATDRVLNGALFHSTDMTIEKCAEDCARYKYFGLEFGSECYCSNQYAGVEKPIGDCYHRCAGDSSQVCGGADRISVYAVADLAPEPQPEQNLSQSQSLSLSLSLRFPLRGHSLLTTGGAILSELALKHQPSVLRRPAIPNVR